MQTFEIYHPVNGELNYNCVENKFEYEKIAEVTSFNLGDVFYHSQNDYNHQYAKLGKRSTSVGDIICDPNKKFWLILPIGHKEIQKEWLTFKKAIPNHDLRNTFRTLANR